jgi:hypothetical protein
VEFEPDPDCDMALYAQPQASAAAPATDQAEGPSLDDVAELCEEFGFHYDDTQGESLEILQQMVAAAINRWRAPVAQFGDSPEPDPCLEEVVGYLMGWHEIDGKRIRLTIAVMEPCPETEWRPIARKALKRLTAPPVDQPAAQPVSLAELHDPDFSGGLTPSQHLDVLHGGADPRVAAASAPQPLERLSMGKLVSERIQELLDEVAQRGLEPSSVTLGIRAEELLRKEVRKSLLFQRNANQDNPLPLPNTQDQLFVYGVQINKSDVEAAEYVGIECQ